LECVTGISLIGCFASMAFAVVIGEVMLVKVIITTAYGEDRRADYPNLAGKFARGDRKDLDSPLT